MAIFFEARGEPDIGKYAVGEVVLNRSEKYDKPICDIVFEANQFSWTKHIKHPPSTQSKSWNDCSKIANNLLENKTDYSKGALYFNAKSMGNRFGNKTKRIIGNHIFF